MRREQDNGNANFIPDDISGSLNSLDIPMVFDYLEKTFHISKYWRVVYKNEVQQRPSRMHEAEFFCRFLKEHIEPPINRLRIREDSVFQMLRYLLKDRIAERERQEARYFGYYDHEGKFKKSR
jgi:hypothetical protein